jgi:hypothetical protein
MAPERVTYDGVECEVAETESHYEKTMYRLTGPVEGWVFAADVEEVAA